MQDVVFLDGTETPRFRKATYISPGPRAEVKIFIGNLPPDTQSAFVVDLASPYGEVQNVKVLPSKLKHTRRCAAIMYMSSDSQADAAIDAIPADQSPGALLLRLSFGPASDLRALEEEHRGVWDPARFLNLGNKVSFYQLRVHVYLARGLHGLNGQPTASTFIKLSWCGQSTRWPAHNATPSSIENSLAPQ